MDDISNTSAPAAAPDPTLSPAMKAYLDSQLVGYKQSLFEQYQQQWTQAEAKHQGVQEQMQNQLKVAEEKERGYRDHIASLEERLQQLEHREVFEKDAADVELLAKGWKDLVPAADTSISAGVAARRGTPATPKKAANPETPRKGKAPATFPDGGGNAFSGNWHWDEDEDEGQQTATRKPKQTPAPTTPRKTLVNTPRKSRRRQEGWDEEEEELTKDGDQDDLMEDADDEQWLKDEREGQEEEEEGKRERRRTYQLKKKDFPEDTKGYKQAMEFYVRMCWGLLTTKAIPKPPTTAMLEAYHKNYKSKAAVLAQHCSKDRVSKSIKGVLCLAHLQKAKSRSNIVLQARKMEEKVVKHVDREFARMGLPQWCPDLRQSPYSGYNELHRIVLINTFQMIVRADAFAEYRLNPKYIEDNDFLIRLYDHIVHDFHYRRFMADPTKLAMNAKLNGISQNRSRLGKARHTFMAANGYSELRLRLADTSATSDDEQDPDSKDDIFYIRRRPERSEAAEAFIRELERKRKDTAIHKSGTNWRQRDRVIPPQGEQKDTYFPSLPEAMPIDYFDPAFYNGLQPSLRSKIAVPEVALRQYDPTKATRNEILARYRIPGISCEDEDQTEEEVEGEREALSAHLSAQMVIG